MPNLEQERTERLEYASKQLAKLTEVSNRFTQIYNEDELWEEVPILLTQTLDFDRATVILTNGSSFTIRSLCFVKDSPEFVQNFLDRTQNPDFKIPQAFLDSFEKKETIFIADLNVDPRWPKDAGQPIRTKAVVISPIKVENEPIGLLFGNMQHHVRQMDQEDVLRFEMFANMVGLALENIRAYQSLEKKVLDRTKSLRDANRELREKASELLLAHEMLEKRNLELSETLDDLAQTNRVLRETQGQLVQSEKMAALGMLVAGIAHEINTPVAAIHSMHDTLLRGLDKLQKYVKVPDNSLEERQLKTALEIIEDANRIIETGCERVTEIVKRLRSFARLDEAELKEVDIHEGLEDTLMLIHHEIKHCVKVEKEYGQIPQIACYPGRLNQVFLNILINAKQAIKDCGEIRIRTYVTDNKVHIAFKDTGIGIPKENLRKLFDPGFTTKGVGVGTGLGLSICYQIIQDHKGEIRVESEPGQGSEFTIILPTNLQELTTDKHR